MGSVTQMASVVETGYNRRHRRSIPRAGVEERGLVITGEAVPLSVLLEMSGDCFRNGSIPADIGVAVCSKEKAVTGSGPPSQSWRKVQVLDSLLL
jgi:hypothetical protein